MSQKEKRFLRETLLAALCLIGVYMMIQIISGLFLGKEYTDYIFQANCNAQYDELEPDQLELKLENGKISLKEITKEDGRLVMTLLPVKAGKEYATLINKDTEETLLYIAYYVSPTGLITNRLTGNFTHYRLYHLYIVLLVTALTILLWWAFLRAHRQLRYSYQAIFFSGLAIWMTVLTAYLWFGWFREDVMEYTYSLIQGMAGQFMAVSAPLLLIFCVALSVSNISLIRHEGFRTTNALGIILSVVMLGGLVLDFILSNLFSSGSENALRIYEACTGIYSTAYAFMECFLIGAVICGTLAAGHEPDYDKDYLIILGCKVKPDGTLYPLIQGRVDRAITFYKKQLDKTGKKAVFIPSGGQGSDEQVSEAEAMKRYLLLQGIPAEQIIAENQSKNTVQNMKFSKKIIEDCNPEAKTAFSTTNFHVFRSGIISRQNDFEPDGMGSPTKWYFWPNAYMREVIGMMSYKWKSILIVMIPIILFLFISRFTLTNF